MIGLTSSSVLACVRLAQVTADLLNLLGSLTAIHHPLLFRRIYIYHINCIQLHNIARACH